MKLGSLFDGSGTCPLAAALCGIEPVWASEIEPYPIRVTKKNFPQMKHLGDVTQIKGDEIEPVDIITFGSPCQDLSVAGKRAGIHEGERSSLFFEAIRIIREMREKTHGRYPTVAVWENVPGAFSSNRGQDFLAVLQAFVEIAGGCNVPEPAVKQGKLQWGKDGCIMEDGFSLAWRMLDAQFWGVPQRRKRIYLVADFAGRRAPEILFKREGLSGDSAESGAARMKAAGVKAGVPDMFLPVARGGSHGLYIELKRIKGGRVSAEQLAWMEELTREGYTCAVCHGWEEARETILNYLKG
nr:MAG TPA: Cytosine specific methyltransferase [Caudoviricetes sp.]